MGPDLLPVPIGGLDVSPRELTTEGLFSFINGYAPEHVGMVSGYYLGIYPQKSKSRVSQFGAIYSA